MRCAHARAVPVESTVTGELLAALCPDCDHQLPAEFLTCPHTNVIDIVTLGELPGRGVCNDCGTTGWYGRPRAVITLGSDVTAEDMEAFKEGFLAAQKEPHRILFVPTIASLSVPTITSLDAPTYADLNDIPNSWW